MAISFSNQAMAAVSASDIISKTAEKINNAESITALFTTDYGDNRHSGSLTIAKSKFVIKSKDYALWYNGVHQWAYSKATGETNLTIPTPDELMETNPFAIINHYKTRYDIRLLSSPAGTYKVEMTSRIRSAAITKAILTIDRSSYLPTSIYVTLSNDTSMTISISSAKTGGVLPATDFEFPSAQYPGVEIIDLR